MLPQSHFSLSLSLSPLHSFSVPTVFPTSLSILSVLLCPYFCGPTPSSGPHSPDLLNTRSVAQHDFSGGYLGMACRLTPYPCPSIMCHNIGVETLGASPGDCASCGFKSYIRTLLPTHLYPQQLCPAHRPLITQSTNDDYESALLVFLTSPRG